MSRPPRWIDESQFSRPELVSAFDDLNLWAAPFGLALLDVIRMKGVRAALDVGCGAGFPLVEIADRLGPGARVVGLDPWEAALTRAREKARTRGLEGVEIVVGKAENLPFADATFDLVVSNNGLNNVAEPERALAECARVARTGAHFVMTANLPDSMRELYDVYEAVLRDKGHEAFLPKLAAHIHHKRKPVSLLVQWIEAAGFHDVRAHERSFRMRFADGTAMFRHWMMRLGFVEAWARVLPDDTAPSILDAIEERLNARAAEIGEIALTIPFACIEATK